MLEGKCPSKVLIISWSVITIFLLLRKPVTFLKISEPPFFQIWKYMERDFSKRLANADVFIYE